MVVIEIITKEKKIKKCSASCYEGIAKACVCVCEGLNHGVGLEKAAKNVLDHEQEIREKYKDAIYVGIPVRTLQKIVGIEIDKETSAMESQAQS